MSPAELQANEELRRHEFPVVRQKVFLAHAGVSPLPRRVAQAMAAYAEAATAEDQDAALGPGFVAETRRRAARLLQAQPEEIALIGPTSLALSFVAAGLPWKRGQNILVYHDDFASNVYPWMALADRGVQVRFLNVRELGRIRMFDVQGQVDEDTRLVALASAHFVSGWRIEVEALGRWLQKRGIWFCVDAIQTLGAFPTTVAGVDFLAADSHKWLLGPCGAGVLYVRKELQAVLKPVVHGWHNVRCPEFVAQDDISFRTDARRYEAGSQNLVGLAGLRAALELVDLVGIDAIAADLIRKREWLERTLRDCGFDVLLRTLPAENSSGIIAFARPGEESAALFARLSEGRVVASLRTTREGRRWIRLSPHYYNTDAELARVIELLGASSM